MHIFLIFILFFLITPTVHAQGFEEVSIQLEPEYPTPNSTVKARLQSYAQNLQSVNIGWYLDDVLLKKGTGLTEITLATPILGESINVFIKIDDEIIAKRTITPTTIDILWEADTYTPSLYNGRALPTDSSKIRAMAIPHTGTPIDTDTLIYNWYIGGQFLSELSGVGKDTITIPSPGLYDVYNLSVEITDTRGLTIGKNGVRIANTEPELLLYTLSPLLGIQLNKALAQNTPIYETTQNITEKTIVAIPYYFSTQTPEALNYTWQTMRVQTFQQPVDNIITLGNAQNNAYISVLAEHPTILLQSAKTDYSFSNPSNLTDVYDIYQSSFGDFDNQ